MKIRRTLWRTMQSFGWHKAEHDNHLRGRTYHVALRRFPWWDWGHPTMIATGTCVGGNYQPPHPSSLWYRFEGRNLRVLHSYAEYRKAVEGAEDDWHWIGCNQDGELTLGYYESGGFYGLSQSEQRLLLRYMLRWRLADWFGLRSWLYCKALHSAVHQRIPFRCQATPPKGSGGYDHWHCQEPKRHAGPHRFNNYEWDGRHNVKFAPKDGAP